MRLGYLQVDYLYHVISESLAQPDAEKSARDYIFEQVHIWKRYDVPMGGFIAPLKMTDRLWCADPLYPPFPLDRPENRTILQSQYTGIPK